MGDKEVVLDLAYAEFMSREAQGTNLDVEEFASHFPLVRDSLVRLIEVHRVLNEGAAGLDSGVESAWPAPGTGTGWLGFELLEELGRGAFARVYLARETALGGRLVVVKAAALAYHEAKLLGRLEHPNIVPVHSVQRDNELSLSAIAMPYLGRVTLLNLIEALRTEDRSWLSAASLLGQIQRLDRAPAAADLSSAGPLAGERWPRRWTFQDAVLHIGIGLARALEYAHSRGILHYDIKSSNVLITREGRPLLLDFNVAAGSDSKVRLNGGTLPYMAPEQLRGFVLAGESREIQADCRTDIFSLGVTLFELLYGRLPFGLPAEADPIRFAARLLERQQQGPLDGPGAADPAIAAILRQCLEYDAARRPESAQELLKLFEAESKPLRRARRWGRVHRQQIGIAAVVLTVVALSLAGWAAHRPPYVVREWQAGRAAFTAGDDAGAQRHLTTVLDEQPDSRAARFLRGCAACRRGDSVAAFDDFERLWRDDADGCVSAALAHVIYLMGIDNRRAAEMYHQALEKGCCSALLENNAGFCLLKVGRLDEAIANLRQACIDDPSFSAARHNLACAEFQVALNKSHPISLASLEAALQLGPESAGLYLDAARIYAFAARTNPEKTEKGRLRHAAFEFLNRAIDLGAGSQQLSSVATRNDEIRGDPRWRQAEKRIRPDAVFRKVTLYLDPLDELATAIANDPVP